MAGVPVLHPHGPDATRRHVVQRLRPPHPAAVARGVVAVKTHRRTVGALAAPGIQAARDLYLSVPSDSLRVAALVEIAAAAASLARTVVRLRHLDPDLIVPHVRDATDLRAVLGRGRWLPTMTRHVPSPFPGPVMVADVVPLSRSVRHRVQRSVRAGSQDALFEISA